MRTGESIFLAVSAMIVVGLTVWGYAVRYPSEAMLFPTLVAACMIAFGVMRVLEARRLVEAAPLGGSSDKEGESDESTVRSVLRSFSWVAAVAVVLPVLGYQVGLPVYVFLFLIAHRVRLATSLAIAAGTAVFIYLVFVRGLQVLLPTGAIGSLLP